MPKVRMRKIKVRLKPKKKVKATRKPKKAGSKLRKGAVRKNIA